MPCPSAHRPEQNRHRSGDRWQAPTVAAILQNPRYTGYAVFGRWTKREELIDPDDVAAWYAIRFVRATADRIIRSRRPAHPQIVSVENFTEAHLIRRSRAGINNRDGAKLEPTRSLIPRLYLLRGHIRCDAFNRKMQAEMVGQNIYYRCRAKTLALGSDALADHPKTVNLRESILVDPLDGWLSTLFDCDHRNQTIATLLKAQEADDTDAVRACCVAELPTRTRSYSAT
ncbi:recombinase family protein [Nocardia brasiliensis]|uniref:recombinase family protein n=1 Tax=Nocardia brasiliensis TaxID=37326 RepID=UPI0036702F40